VSQLCAPLHDSAVVAVFGFAMAYAWFKFSNLMTPLRVPAEVEIGGLDIPEVGAPGDPDVVLTRIGGGHSVAKEEE
jgi:ammonium transporter, Amt family